MKYTTKRSAENGKEVVSNKRQRKLSKASSEELSSPQSSKLDFLAHIAELYSDKDEVLPVQPVVTPPNVASEDKKASSGPKKAKALDEGVKNRKKERKSAKTAKSSKKGGSAKASAPREPVVHSKENFPKKPTPAQGTVTPTNELETRRSFPEKVMELLKNELARDTIWWLPGGTAFAISRNNFSKSLVMKMYFDENSVDSFMKKMDQFGFKNISSPTLPPNTLAFSHRQFSKNAPELAKFIKGEKPIGTNKRSVPQVSPSSSVISEDSHSIASRESPLARPSPAVPRVVSANVGEVSDKTDKKALTQSLLAGMHDTVQQELSLRYQQAQQQQQQQLQQLQQTLLLSALMEQQQRANIVAAPAALNSQEVLLHTLFSEEQKRQSLDATLREHLLQTSAIAQPSPQVGLAQLLGARSSTSILDHLIPAQPASHAAVHGSQAALLKQLLHLQQ